MEEAVVLLDVMKIEYRSDEDCQVYVSASRHASPVIAIAKVKTEARQVTFCPIPLAQKKLPISC